MSSASTTCNDTISLLVENTPFTEHELEKLVWLYEEHGHHYKNSRICNDHDQKRNGVVKKEDSVIRMLGASSNTSRMSNTQSDVSRMHLARFIERMLPQAFLKTLEEALFQSDESVYVLNCSVSDVKLLKFVEAMAVLMGRRGSSQVIDFLYDCGNRICSSNGGATAVELVHLCYILAVASSLLSCCCEEKMVQLDTARRYDPPQALVASLAQLAGKQENTDTKVGNTVISRPLFREWINDIAPLLASTLPTFLHHLIFMGNPFPKSRLVPFQFPDLGNQPSAFFGSDPYSPLHFCFGSLSHSLCTKVRTDIFLKFHSILLITVSFHFPSNNNCHLT
jgi:hypothetical protein